MASIRSLLDTFGPPPYEICLDWAYQINALASSPGPAEASIGFLDSAVGTASERAHWTSLEVAEDGSLRLDGLSRELARQALEELREWLARDRSVSGIESEPGLDAAQREIKPGAETFGACDSVDPSSSDCGRFRHHAGRKRGAGHSSFSIGDRRLHLTVAGVLLAGPGSLLIYVGVGQDAFKPADMSASASAPLGSDETQLADSGSAKYSPGAAPEDDFLLAQDGDESAGQWTTSAELTAAAMNASSTQPDLPIASDPHDALSFAPPPALSAKLSEAATTTLPATSSESSDANALSAATPQIESGPTSAEPLASTEVGDVMSQVAGAAREAELESADQRTDEALSRLEGDEATASEDPTKDPQDWTSQPALMLSRDAGVLRPSAPRELSRRLREPHWKARIEVADGFICEPASVQTVDSRTGAQWRIYARDAQSPRACVIVSARRRSPREPDLEWSVHGGAEDVPDLRLPVARKWLDVLTAQLKLTAASLRNLTDSPTQKVPRELRSFIQNQRQYARQQLAVAERLLSLLAEIDHLASLLDDELVCHAELSESQDGPVLLRYGKCEPDVAEADDENPQAD